MSNKRTKNIQTATTTKLWFFHPNTILRHHSHRVCKIDTSRAKRQANNHSFLITKHRNSCAHARRPLASLSVCVCVPALEGVGRARRGRELRRARDPGYIYEGGSSRDHYDAHAPIPFRHLTSSSFVSLFLLRPPSLFFSLSLIGRELDFPVFPGSRSRGDLCVVIFIVGKRGWPLMMLLWGCFFRLCGK